MENTQQPASRGFFDAPPKFMFAFGLIGGVAVLSTAGLIITLIMLLGDGKTQTASNTQNTNTGQVAGATDPTNTQPTQQQPTEPTANPDAIRPIGDDDHVRGAADAAVTLMEYSDFECPYCGQFAPSVEQLLAEFPDDVRVVYRHFPLSFHPEAQPAAIASECAADQGKFWEYHDQLFANQALLATDYYPQLAGELGLDVTAFNDCVTNQANEKLERIQQDYTEGATAGVTGTPATFINDQLVSGAQPYASLKAAVEAAL